MNTNDTNKQSVVFPILGQLEIIDTLFYYDCPVFFVCKNDFGNLYLTICISFDANEYIAVEVNEQIVDDVKNNKIEMCQPFIGAVGKLYRFSYRYNSEGCEEIQCKEILQKELPFNMLPPKGAYLNK